MCHVGPVAPIGLIRMGPAVIDQPVRSTGSYHLTDWSSIKSADLVCRYCTRQEWYSICASPRRVASSRKPWYGVLWWSWNIDMCMWETYVWGLVKRLGVDLGRWGLITSGRQNYILNYTAFGSCRLWHAMEALLLHFTCTAEVVAANPSSFWPFSQIYT